MPGKIFNRRWATTLLEQAMPRLREKCVSNHKSDPIWRDSARRSR
jgi:hypothetical protein